MSGAYTDYVHGDGEKKHRERKHKDKRKDKHEDGAGDVVGDGASFARDIAALDTTRKGRIGRSLSYSMGQPPLSVKHVLRSPVRASAGSKPEPAFIERLLTTKVDAFDRDRMPSPKSRIDSHRALTHSRSFSELSRERSVRNRRETASCTPSPRSSPLTVGKVNVPRGTPQDVCHHCAVNGKTACDHTRALLPQWADNADSDDTSSSSSSSNPFTYMNQPHPDSTRVFSDSATPMADKASRVNLGSAKAYLDRTAGNTEDAYEYSYVTDEEDAEEKKEETRHDRNLAQFNTSNPPPEHSTSNRHAHLGADAAADVLRHQSRFAKRPRSTSIAAMTRDYIQKVKTESQREEAKHIHDTQMRESVAASIFGPNADTTLQVLLVQAQRKKHIPPQIIQIADVHGIPKEKNVFFLIDLSSFVDNYKDDMDAIWKSIRRAMTAIYKHRQHMKRHIKRHYARGLRAAQLKDQCAFHVHLLLTDIISERVVAYLEKYREMYAGFVTWSMYTAYPGYPTSTQRTCIYAIRISEADKQCGEPRFAPIVGGVEAPHPNKFFLCCGDKKLARNMFKTHVSGFQRQGIYIVHHASVLMRILDIVKGQLAS